MPRTGLSSQDVVAAAAALADEAGFRELTMSLHPGRYTATVGTEFTGPDDPLLGATSRLLGSIAAMLRGYGISDAEMVDAIRTIRCTMHGFAALQATDGFQWSGDPGKTFDWMIHFIDGGLRAARSPA